MLRCAPISKGRRIRGGDIREKGRNILSKLICSEYLVTAGSVKAFLGPRGGRPLPLRHNNPLHPWSLNDVRCGKNDGGFSDAWHHRHWIISLINMLRSLIKKTTTANIYSCHKLTQTQSFLRRRETTSETQEDGSRALTDTFVEGRVNMRNSLCGEWRKQRAKPPHGQSQYPS